MTNEHVERFNLAAPGYDTDRYPGRAECMRKVLDILEPRNEDVILDVGCGPGAQLIRLAPSITMGYGVDPAERMIEQAKQAARGLPNIFFYVGGAEVLPPEARQAGATKIFSNYALHHLTDDAKRSSIMSLASVLPPGGRLVLGDLMFSENPDHYKDLFETVGYGPGCDTPARLSVIEEAFKAAGLNISTYVLNPLVAVIVGRKA